MKRRNVLVLLVFVVVATFAADAIAVYHAPLGRWLQRDPLAYSDSFALYQYLRSAPLGLPDPYGLFGLKAGYNSIASGLSHNYYYGDGGSGGTFGAPSSSAGWQPKPTQGFLLPPGGGEYSQGHFEGGSPAYWTTDIFVWHYFFGHGEAVNLRDIGLLDVFKNAPSVKQAVAGFREIVKNAVEGKAESMNCCKKVFDIFSDENYAITNVEFEIYSLGHSTFFRRYDCILIATACSGRDVTQWFSGCLIKFWIRDWFKEPLDIPNVEIPGGTPYRINADWTDFYFFRSSP